MTHDTPARQRPLTSEAPRGPRTVLILSGDTGEGHLAAARALCSELREEAPDVRVVSEDGLAIFGTAVHRIVRDGYHLQLRSAPWTYQLLYGLGASIAPLRWIGAALLDHSGRRRLRDLVRQHSPMVIASTHPATTVALGRMRRCGKLEVPVCSIITDFSGLTYWAHPGVDQHVVMYDESIAAVERVAGRGSAERARPLVQPAFRSAVDRGRAREHLGIADDEELVIVSGGGWGVGDLEGAVAQTLRRPRARIVCVTGRNEALHATLAAVFVGEPRVEVLGFTDRLSELLTAADALVHTTAGVTCLEASVRGCPAVVYGNLPGHVRRNANAMARAGLVQTATRARDLPAALDRAIASAADAELTPPSAPTTATLVTAAVPRQTPEVVAPLVATCSSAAVALAFVTLDGWGFLGEEAYSAVGLGLVGALMVGGMRVATRPRRSLAA